MLIGTHLITGGVLGEVVGNPIAAFGVGLLSHFCLDSIPHYDLTDGGKITKRQIALILAEVTIAILLIALMKPSLAHNSPFLWGGLGGVLPDLVDNVPLWNKSFRKLRFGYLFNQFHEWTHHYRPPAWLGLLSQAVTLIIMLIIHFKLIK
ncbi:MAG: hypothetical protein NTW50_00020 [Candidatus Berkelbacteria bacterium]|nr:hypothetical protein [Candidatus Berkelbacteria bacterium]